MGRGSLDFRIRFLGVKGDGLQILELSGGWGVDWGLEFLELCGGESLNFGIRYEDL